jgi:spore cortex biosynthesis protein YabQ
MLDTATQGLEFISAIYTGIVVGIFYEVCRIIRKLSRNNKIISAIADTLFWCGVGVILFLANLIINGARARWYLFAGNLLGIVLHFYSTGIIMNYIYQVAGRKRKARLMETEGKNGKEKNQT